MQIRALGKKAGVALDPATSPEFIDYVLHLCDVILVMTVNPGFGGQGFLPEMLPKIRRLRTMCAERGLQPIIEVDGGENPMTAGDTAAAGATAIVAGSAIFGTADYAAAIAGIRASATAGGGAGMSAVPSPRPNDRDALKRAAAEAAVKLVENDMVVGLGSGSTAAFAIEALARLRREGLRFVGIPTSQRAADSASAAGIPLTSFGEHRQIDLTIDGADEVERGTLNLIKGRRRSVAA